MFEHLLPLGNTFLEDSSVLVGVAYLLTRGGTLSLLFPSHPRTRREILLLGAIIGGIGATEYIWPGLRSPYAVPTLFVTFAVRVGGVRVGSIAAFVLAALGFLFLFPSTGLTTMLAIGASLLIACLMRRLPENIFSIFVAGAAPQAATLLIYSFISELTNKVPLSTGFASVVANGVGLSLLLLVAREARLRAEADKLHVKAERLQAEAQQVRTLGIQHQLDALQARLHPHFLFNTLTAIASLCGSNPRMAETATLRLSELMRRVLETDTSAIPINEEVAAVTAYLAIERLRFAEKLRVRWQVDPAVAHTNLPRFSLLTLVENAVTHGVSSMMRGGTVTVTARGGNGRLLVAVADDGAGMSCEQRASALNVAPDRLHGLILLDRQLRLQYGRGSRLRIFSEPGRGTLIAFRLPLSETAVATRQEKPTW